LDFVSDQTCVLRPATSGSFDVAAERRRVWVTRAEPGASRTAARLRRIGFVPEVRPVLAIRPLPQPEPELSGVAALAFTSPNGVAAFAGLSPHRHLPVFTVGDATAEAARQAGWERVTSASGAVDDLAKLLLQEADGPVLAPGAREPAGDLPALTAATLQVRRLPVYEAIETFSPPPRDWSIVLIHSPRAGRAVSSTLGPGSGVDRLCVAISPAAAAPLERLGFAGIRIAARPDESAMFEALGNPGADV
jgi:uroporphyrinogen-III synthase